MAVLSPFKPALGQLQPQPPWSVFGPQSFQKYAATHGLQAKSTAYYISVNTRSGLDSQLAAQDTMVFRLGASGQGNTAFALLKGAPGSISDFFLDTSLLAGQAPARTFLPETAVRDLFPYFLLGTGLTEGSLVNFAFASGALSWALNLDQKCGAPAPAKGNGGYTFDVRPHSLCAITLRHNQGQVDVDAAFLGRRGGTEVLFVLEAKCSEEPDPLAKHKLVYPILALAARVPADIPIVPLYLRVWVDRNALGYEMAECIFPDPRSGKLPGVDELAVKRVVRFLVPMLSLP
jgi:hypothetical protein